MAHPDFATLEEAFVYCREMDASLADRMQLFAEVSRAMRPEMQEAVDRMVKRLEAHQAGALAPGPGDVMPSFALPDDAGHAVTLESLLVEGPTVITFHRGHWCPYCRINARVLGSLHERIVAVGASIVAVVPELEKFAAALKADAGLRYPVLCDMDNGYALSISLAIYVGDELQTLMGAAGRDLPRYQDNDSWILPIPATFVVAQDGRVAARFIDPDYRKRMAEDHVMASLWQANPP
jgi:peroxiredoxin